jgi:hypothetical protein
VAEIDRRHLMSEPQIRENDLQCRQNRPETLSVYFRRNLGGTLPTITIGPASLSSSAARSSSLLPASGGSSRKLARPRHDKKRDRPGNSGRSAAESRPFPGTPVDFVRVMDRNSRPRSRSGDSGRLPALRCAARGRHSPVLRTWEMPRRDSRPRSRSGHPARRHAEASPWGRFVTSRASRRESSLRSARGTTPPWPLRRLLPFVLCAE